MGLQARVSVITLGVTDVPRARDFYQALGWPLSGAPQDGVAFFKNAGSRLALYSREAMAEEAGRAAAPPGSIGVTLAINLESRELVDEALAAAVKAGGTLLRPAQERFWGGYSGYFADPDGHAWEVAHNPFWPIGEDGLPQLPGQRHRAADAGTRRGQAFGPAGFALPRLSRRRRASPCRRAACPIVDRRRSARILRPS